MAQNYILLETIELTQSAASVTFDNLPASGYTDLKLVMSGRDTISADFNSFTVAFNGSSTGFTGRQLIGTGSSAISNTVTTALSPLPGATLTASTFSNVELYIPNAFGSANKSFSWDGVLENNATAVRTILGAGLWSNTAAITSVTIGTDGTAYAANSTFSLYGVAADGTTPVTGPKAFGGNMVSNDGTYWIHTFLTSGTFTPATTLSCDYLVVAGGGGAPGAGGGGGGGMLIDTTALSLNTSYTVTIGAGGSGTFDEASSNRQGSNSVLGSFTAIGGGSGAGGAVGFVTGGSGGSGGGAAAAQGGTTITASGGTPTSGQGNAGGSITSVFRAGAGGGGAGVAGTNLPSGGSVGSTGGNGLASSISGSSVTYAGGGGGTSWTATGGLGGSGGGGNGGSDSSGSTAGGVNTGGGGGGARGVSPNGAGGSGIVIIRYAMA